MAQRHMALRATAARQGEDIHAARRGGFFALTPALALGERVRVRGNGANYHPAYRLAPGNVELSRSSGGYVFGVGFRESGFQTVVARASRPWVGWTFRTGGTPVPLR